MAPRQTPAKRTTASKRTTPRKTAAERADFEWKPSGKKKVRKTMSVAGRVWHVRRPNQALVSQLLERQTISSLTDYLLAHIDPAEHQDFMTALAALPDFDLEDLGELCDTIGGEVYEDLPTPPS